MLVEIGALNNIYCPTCGKKNSFEEIECKYTVKNNILRVESLVECEECGGSFKVVQHFTVDFLNCYVQEIPKPEKKKLKNEGCPHWVFFCEDCYKNDTEMCPHWRNSNG